MADRTGVPAAATIEQCVDEIDDFIETLVRYPESVIAMALRVHLGALLRAMVDDQLCSRAEVRGCTGKSTGSGSASISSTRAVSLSGGSTLPALWALSSR